MDLLFWVKIAVAISIVMLLSFVAERISPKVAGLLSGYPLGAAISLFFYGIEVSPAFAARSALYTMAGLVASLVFVYCYFQASLRLRRLVLPLSSAAAIMGYTLAAWLLHHIRVSALTGVLMPVVFIFVFSFLFRAVRNEKIVHRVSLTYRILFLRAVFAAALIVLITGSARRVGSTWAGLFSAFPVTLFPMMLIVHFTYGAGSVHTIIKNFPIGLGSLVTYAFSVSLAYPEFGVFEGTLISFMTATAYLGVYTVLASTFKKKFIEIIE